MSLHRITQLFSLCAVAFSCVISVQPAAADTLVENLFYDGSNVTATSFDYAGSLTSSQGIEFDFSIRLTATDMGGNVANLRTNGGTTNREFGVRALDNMDNSAAETGESITAALQAVTITNFNGIDPSDVSVNFDGFSDVILYFVGNGSDAVNVTDGSNNSLFSFEGSLDPMENGGMPTAMGAPFTFGVAGESATAGSNALVDFSSGALPTTLIFNGVQHSNPPPPTGSAGEDNNRFRVDDFGVQFTVTVVPEPASAMLMIATGCIFSLKRRRK